MERLGRYGHHSDAANDFCVEVEEIVAIHTDQVLGIDNPCIDGIDRRFDEAMDFRVGGDPIAVRAKQTLRSIYPTPSAPPQGDG